MRADMPPIDRAAREKEQKQAPRIAEFDPANRPANPEDRREWYRARGRRNRRVAIWTTVGVIAAGFAVLYGRFWLAEHAREVQRREANARNEAMREEELARQVRWLQGVRTPEDVVYWMRAEEAPAAGGGRGGIRFRCGVGEWVFPWDTTAERVAEGLATGTWNADGAGSPQWMVPDRPPGFRVGVVCPPELRGGPRAGALATILEGFERRFGRPLVVVDRWPPAVR